MFLGENTEIWQRDLILQRQILEFGIEKRTLFSCNCPQIWYSKAWNHRKIVLTANTPAACCVSLKYPWTKRLRNTPAHLKIILIEIVQNYFLIVVFLFVEGKHCPVFEVLRKRRNRLRVQSQPCLSHARLVAPCDCVSISKKGPTKHKTS